MGGATSRGPSATAGAGAHLRGGEEEIVKLMMPVYYNDKALTSEEYQIAEQAWNLILTDSSKEFNLRRKDPNFPHPSCIVFFYNSFYTRLFDIHPLARDLFKDVQSQGKFLVKMISLSLSERADEKRYRQTLIKLAEIHNERGIKAAECK